MGHVEPDHASRRGFRHRSPACFRRLQHARCRPGEFIKQIAGTNAQFQTEDIDGQLKRAIVTEFSDALGEMKIPALDLAAQYKELGEAIRAKINEDFKTYGLEVTKFYVENISLPPEVEAAMDKRASMGALGDAQKYMQFQAADALRDAAQNEGGGAGLGAGLGAGFAVGGPDGERFWSAGPQGGGQAPTRLAPHDPVPDMRQAERGRRKILLRLRRQNGNRQSPVRKMRRRTSRRCEILLRMRIDPGKSKMRQLPA